MVMKVPKSIYLETYLDINLLRKYIKRVPTLDINPRKNKYINQSSQLGWGVHNFGHISPYTNISSQLGWSVRNFGYKSA